MARAREPAEHSREKSTRWADRRSQAFPSECRLSPWRVCRRERFRSTPVQACVPVRLQYPRILRTHPLAPAVHSGYRLLEYFAQPAQARVRTTMRMPLYGLLHGGDGQRYIMNHDGFAALCLSREPSMHRRNPLGADDHRCRGRKTERCHLDPA
jgi:hypothetical protein